MIGLINYGSGNINAIANVYKRLNIPYYIINNVDQFDKAEKLILPGVGDFDETMELLENKNYISILNQYVLEKKIPILGVCVGMQVLGNSSEEGTLEGFGWINGQVRKINKEKINQKPYLPHMGWNSIKVLKEHPIFSDINESDGFYFLHNYYFDCANKDNVLCTTNFGQSFATAINRENIYGTQFHPEKSHDNGMMIFKNFANL